MNNISLSKLILSCLAIFITLPVVPQVNPQLRYNALFRDVQSSRIFQDQKRFADCPSKIDPDSVSGLYNIQKNNPNFVLKDFVGTYFDTVQVDTASLFRHLDLLWNNLTKLPEPQNPNSSMIALPEAYIVPGGRFQEIYYWDSYFTMLGLQVSGRTDMIEHMVNNFAWLINTYGHIPNGNRTYYLSRSQPPFFAMMVKLLADARHDQNILTRYLKEMEIEYNYWMSGEKVVRLEGGKSLNRYWDELDTPRPESWLHDVETYNASNRDSSIFRDLRSAAESGWDFSTRWFADGKSINKIVTTQYLPVDLNCLLYNIESTLSEGYLINKSPEKAQVYSTLAKERKDLILNYFWDNSRGYFFDYNHESKTISDNYNLAGLFPLFFNLVDRNQAEKVVLTIKEKLLYPGGLVTTNVKASGQQWDYPNGWAPLQWIGYLAMKNYGYNDLANEIATRWTNLNMKVYFETGKMTEKYDVVHPDRPGGGGEYENQDGFGWTNGVFLKLWNELKQ